MSAATIDPTPAAVRLAEWKAEARRLKAAADSAAAELARINRELDRAQAYVRDYAQLLPKQP